MQVLQVDRAGIPVQWLNLERAAYRHSRGTVAWSLGETCATLRGGTNALTGRQSRLELKPIIAVVGENSARQPFLWREPPLSSSKLFRRDRLMCAYCGVVHREDALTLDHIQPESRGGATSWMNLVAACRGCNNRKDNLTPEEARMPLLYLPYAPSLHETFILGNRAILADQMEFLAHAVPAHSRVHAS
jgi:hypothetical protein